MSTMSLKERSPKAMEFEAFKNDFIKFTMDVIEQDKGDGWPVCPYARKARVNGEIQFMDGRDLSYSKTALETFDKSQFKMAVCWMGDDCDIDVLDSITSEMRELYPKYHYFVSTELSGLFVKNFTRIIIVQIKEDIEDRRKKLIKTNYYDSWTQEYYDEIVND
jgi:hypothetical protein